MIAAMAIQATAAFIYIRGEYVEPIASCATRFEKRYAAGILGENALGFKRRFDIHIQPGAGAYICGEESGMLESMEGKKGQPRKRPPFPAERGLWSRPTTVDNIETCHARPADHHARRRLVQKRGRADAQQHRPYAVRHQRPCETSRHLTKCRWASRCAT